MSKLVPWKTGAALAATVAIGYTACATFFAISPRTAMEFMSALFHGLDFEPLISDAPWSVAAFAYALVVLTSWAFIKGSIFAWLRNAFEIHRRTSHA